MTLNDVGAVLTLRDSLDRILDRVDSGPQLLNRSIGRQAQDWRLLSALSPGAANAPAAALDAGSGMVINEWLAAGGGTNDFVELYNPSTLPVQLDGWILTDDPSIHGSTNQRLAPLTFIDAGGFAAFHTDGRSHLGPDHLAYQLDRYGETLRLINPSAQIVDSIDFVLQLEGISEGRFPDGNARLVRFPGSVSPGAPNFVVPGDADHDGMEDSWELLHGLDPAFAGDAQLDADNDGITNHDEFLTGTDPNDATSLFRVSIQARLTDGPALHFVAFPGRGYRWSLPKIWRAQSWKELSPPFRVDSSREMLVTDPTPLAQRPTRYYRVAVMP